MKLENPILLGKYARLLDKAKQNKAKERARKRAILLSSNKNQEPFQWPRIFNYGL